MTTLATPNRNCLSTHITLQNRGRPLQNVKLPRSVQSRQKHDPHLRTATFRKTPPGQHPDVSIFVVAPNLRDTAVAPTHQHLSRALPSSSPGKLQPYSRSTFVKEETRQDHPTPPPLCSIFPSGNPKDTRSHNRPDPLGDVPEPRLVRLCLQGPGAGFKAVMVDNNNV